MFDGPNDPNACSTCIPLTGWRSACSLHPTIISIWTPIVSSTITCTQYVIVCIHMYTVSMYIVCICILLYDLLWLDMYAHVYSPSKTLPSCSKSMHEIQIQRSWPLWVQKPSIRPCLQNGAAITQACCSHWGFDKVLSSTMAVQGCKRYSRETDLIESSLGLLKYITHEFLSIPIRRCRSGFTVEDSRPSGGAFSLEDFDQRDHLRCAGKRRSAGIAFLKRPLHIRYSSHFRTSGWKRWNNWLGLLGSLRSSSSSSLRIITYRSSDFIHLQIATNTVKIAANHNYNHSARLVEVMMISGVTLRHGPMAPWGSRWMVQRCWICRLHGVINEKQLPI